MPKKECGSLKKHIIVENLLRIKGKKRRTRKFSYIKFKLYNHKNLSIYGYCVVFDEQPFNLSDQGRRKWAIPK